MFLPLSNLKSLMVKCFLLIKAEDGRKSENALGQVIDANRFLNGARVGIVAKPSAEFVAGLLGTWLSGGVAVPLALSYPEAELLHVMNDSVHTKYYVFLSSALFQNCLLMLRQGDGWFPVAIRIHG